VTTTRGRRARGASRECPVAVCGGVIRYSRVFQGIGVGQNTIPLQPNTFLGQEVELLTRVGLIPQVGFGLIPRYSSLSQMRPKGCLVRFLTDLAKKILNDSNRICQKFPKINKRGKPCLRSSNHPRKCYSTCNNIF
jgi:hypothetical protein